MVYVVKQLLKRVLPHFQSIGKERKQHVLLRMLLTQREPVLACKCRAHATLLCDLATIRQDGRVQAARSHCQG